MPFLKIKKPQFVSVALLFVTLILGIILGQLLDTHVRAARETGVVAPDATPLSIPQALPVGNEFTKLAKRLEPSVVYIQADYLAKASVVKKGQQSEEGGAEGDDPQNSDPGDLLKKWFGEGQAPPHSFRQEGSGTGFVVDKNGYIITNYHVVDHADRVKVKLHGDDKEYRARIVGSDVETDIAVLKIDAKKTLTPVQMGNSDSVEVGDWAIAIGSPFGLEATVTAGIVSATERDVKSFQHDIQTDAAINPGNSGGPLVNIRGEVIGVNTMIATQTGSYMGIGFALPSNVTVKVYNDIIRSGRVVCGSIGVKWRPGDEHHETLEAFGLDHGVVVEDVPKDGPAGKAGVKEGDVILSLNDHPVHDGNDLIARVADLPVGSTALLTVDRNGKRLDYKASIEERASVWQKELEGSAEVAPRPELGATKAPEPKFGITITRVTDTERKELGVTDKIGVRVVSVDPGSFADDIGLTEGDVIVSINRQDVGSPADVLKIQGSLKGGQAVALRVVRAGGVQGHKDLQRLWVSGRLPGE